MAIQPMRACFKHDGSTYRKMLDLLEEKYTDFEIQSHGKIIKCHKIILYITCDYFANMIDSCLKESTQNKVEMDTVDPDVIEDIVYYLYGETVDFFWENIRAYIDTSELLQLTELKNMLESYTLEHITVQSCIRWSKFAERYLINISRYLIKLPKIHEV